jgi:hypothetical protein
VGQHQQRRETGRVTRLYRGHRIRAVLLGETWHVIVHGRTGRIVSSNIESLSLADGLAQAEWVIEARLKFQPPARGERKESAA